MASSEKILRLILCDQLNPAHSRFEKPDEHRLDIQLQADVYRSDFGQL